MRGTISDVRLYDHALTEEEIAAVEEAMAHEKTIGSCKVPGCDTEMAHRTKAGQAQCAYHYQRARRYGGDPLGGVRPKTRYPRPSDEVIAHALVEALGNVPLAAESLGVPEWALGHWLRKSPELQQYKRDRRRDRSPITDLPPEEKGHAGFRRIVQSDPCSYCGDGGGTADHIVAIKRGGARAWSNLTGACVTCNTSKGARFSLLSFLLYGGPKHA